MQAKPLVQIDSHATATLRYIRACMDGAASISVPGSAGYAMGAVGLSAAVLSSVSGLREHWFAIWLVAALLATVLGGVLMAQPISLRGLALSRAPARKFLMCLLPSLLGGAVLTAVLWGSGNMQAVAGTWLLLYGCALIPASVSATSRIAVMGGLFIALSLPTFLLPHGLQMLMLGAGFGGLHLLFGFLIGRSRYDREA